MKRTLLSLCVAGATTLSGFALPTNGTIFVSPTGNDANDGSSWAQAKASLDGAFAAAKGTAEGSYADAKDIWMQGGTYALDSAVYYHGGDFANVYVYGSFAGTEGETVETRAKAADAAAWEYTNPTIIDGQSKVPLINGISVKPVSAKTLFNGISFENGLGAGSTIYGRDGMQFVNCSFKNNENTTGNGGGAMNFYTGIADDSAQGFLVENCYFAGNKAADGKQGGALSFNVKAGDKVKVINSIFEKNVHAGAGSAIYVQGTATAEGMLVKGCTFRYNNSTAGSGSGGTEYGTLYARLGTIENCQFYGNEGCAESTGVALTIAGGDAHVINCLMYNNGTGVEKNIIYLKGGNLINNTVVNNIVTDITISTYSTINPQIFNSLVAFNTDLYGGAMKSMGSSKEFSATNCAVETPVEGAVATVEGEIILSADEKPFVKATSFTGTPLSDAQKAEVEAANFGLVVGSQLLGAGVVAPFTTILADIYTNLIKDGQFDVYGNPRLSGEGATINIGAVEGTPEPPASQLEATVDAEAIITTTGNQVTILAAQGEATVYTLSGAVVATANVQESATITLESGIYLVQVMTQGGMTTQKVVIR